MVQVPVPSYSAVQAGRETDSTHFMDSPKMDSGKFRVAVLIKKFLLAAETYGNSGLPYVCCPQFAVTLKLRLPDFYK
jgi:hypothetical protein